MNELGNHLWQSTAFAACVAAACLLLRSNRARVRYWLWLAASAKFLIPFSLLVSLGADLETRVRMNAANVVPSLTATRVQQISTSFSPTLALSMGGPAAAPERSVWALVLVAVWLGGATFFGVRWARRWAMLRALRRRAAPLALDFPIPVLATSSTIEPGVFGFLRPVLLIPEGLLGKLTPQQLDAVLAHELQHVVSRDNLAAALHISVATIFWFHPAVWWIGRSLIEERERACDQAVLGQGSCPETYAQGILNICKSYAESPLPCASGVTGADLKARIREIMSGRVSRGLTTARKIALSAAAVAAIAVPVAIGILRAQTLPPAPAHTYEVVSIKKSDPATQRQNIRPGPQGGLRIQGLPAIQLITFAYDIHSYQLTGAPGWTQSDRFDVDFTPDKPEAAPGPGTSRVQGEGWFNRNRQRLQAVLRDRFGLVLRAETHELPLYALTVAKGGPKLTPSPNPAAGPRMQLSRGEVTGVGVYMNMFVTDLAGLLGRYVRNESGLDGPYDFKLEWTPDLQTEDAPDATRTNGPSIFTALTEQLGLRLESKKGPVPVFVVEKIEKPTEN
jgi:uncharacterized protein (TIGR03435 family)